jgi:hypothetical protein
MSHKTRLTLILIISAISGIIVPQFSNFSIDASESSSYESGYDHGCDDAGISDPDNRYINQPEKGPAFHTKEFMSGYDDGFRSCEEDTQNDNGSTQTNGVTGTVQSISEPVNILSHSAHEDGGYLHVVGEVKNGLSRSIDFVKVTGTFYDAGNSVIGTDFTFTDPSTLEAGETAPFDLSLYTDAVNPGDVADYKLRVSWQ